MGHLVTIADCSPYAAVSHRRSSFPGRRCTCLERFAACTTSRRHHLGSAVASRRTSSGTAFHNAIPLLCLRSDTRQSLSDTLIVSFYLLTYLLIAWEDIVWLRATKFGMVIRGEGR